MNRLNYITEHSCMETIAPRDDWLVRIGHRFINLNYLRSEDVWNRNLLDNSHTCIGKLVFAAPQALERSLYDIIEENPLKCFNYIQTESMRTQVLVPRMARYLSARSIEIICDRIFSKQGINEQFVELFYQYFFDIYFKRFYSWSSLHMLIKASKAYPVHFRSTIKILFKDTGIPNNILLDYVETLDEKNCNDLINFMPEIQLTAAEFNHNLPVIYIVYKKCEKNENVNQYIHSNLELYSEFCAYNKNYGRLLLHFIQNMSGFNVSIRAIKKMIENHFTPFKSPCVTALEKFVFDLITLQMNFHENPRIVIPRPTEDFYYQL